MIATDEKPETFRFVETNCKFCQTKLRLKMFDGCSQFFKNPDRFISIAACNRCADYMEKRRNLISTITSAAWVIATESKKRHDAARRRIEASLTALARLVADFAHIPQPSIAGLVDRIIEEPQSAKRIALSLEPM